MKQSALRLLLMALLFSCASRPSAEPSLWPGLGREQPLKKPDRIKVFIKSENFQREKLAQTQLLLADIFAQKVDLIVTEQRQIIQEVAAERFDLLIGDALIYARTYKAVIPILQAQIDGNWYTNTLIASRASAPFADLSRLAGYSLLFGTSASLHSYIWPFQQIIRRRIKLEQAAHYAVTKADDLEQLRLVQNQQTDLVFINSAAIHWSNGAAATDKFSGLVFYPLGPPIPTDMIAVRASLAPYRRQDFQQRLLKGDALLLKQLGWEAWRPAMRTTYQEVVDAVSLIDNYLG